MFYGRNGFQKDGCDIAYYIEMDSAGGVYGSEAGVQYGGTIPADAYPGHESGFENGRHISVQPVKGGWK